MAETMKKSSTNSSAKYFKIRTFVYITILILGGSGGLLFNQHITIKVVSSLAVIFTVVAIFFDKKYRAKYIPSIPDWLILFVLLFFTCNIVVQTFILSN